MNLQLEQPIFYLVILIMIAAFGMFCFTLLNELTALKTHITTEHDNIDKQLQIVWEILKHILKAAKYFTFQLTEVL